MFKFLCINLVLLVASTSAFSIPDVFRPRGIVSPVITCGGEGIPIQVRVTDCTVPPCNLVPDREYYIESDFIPSADSDGLSFNLVIILEDGIALPGLDIEVPNSAVQAGERYTVAYPLTPNSDLLGRTFDIQIRVYDTASGRIEICIRAPVTIIEQTS